MTSFQAKNRLERPRKREKKITVPFRSVPTRRVIENSKKIQKIKKSQFGLILRQNSSEKDEKERK